MMKDNQGSRLGVIQGKSGLKPPRKFNYKMSAPDNMVDLKP